MHGCPICKRRYHDLEHSENVCAKHETWLVTKCSVCGQSGFSDAAGFCMYHGLGLQEYPARFEPGRPDPTNYLKFIGQEGTPLQGV